MQPEYVNQGATLDTNVDNADYDYIDINVVVPKDSHQYEELRHMPHTAGTAGSKPYNSARRQPPDDVQSGGSPGGTQQKKDGCRRPPCWGWTLIIISLFIAATLVTVLVFLLRPTTSIANLPAPSNLTTAAKPSTQSSTPTPTLQTSTTTQATTTMTSSKNCQDVFNSGQKTSGVYSIYPDGQKEVRVFCEQTISGGGWTVFQRRIDGSVDFYLGWEDYKQGFGDPSGEYWVGNENLHALTANQDTQLLVELQYIGQTAYARYSGFWVLSEVQNYQLNVTGYSGGRPPGDSLTRHDGRPFSTMDRENDNTVSRYSGAWWYSGGASSNLNGLYTPPAGSPEGIWWATWTGVFNSMPACRMMVK